MFAEKGYDKATIKNISEAAGTSQGLMYHYFASKDELLVAVFERHSFIAPLRKILTINDAKPVREVLYTIACDFYSLLASKKELISIVTSEMWNNPVFKKKWTVMPMEGVTLISNYLQSNISAGNLKQHNTEVTARSMLYTIVMLFITSDMFSWSKLTAEQYIKEAIDIFLDGITA